METITYWDTGVVADRGFVKEVHAVRPGADNNIASATRVASGTTLTPTSGATSIQLGSPAVWKLRYCATHGQDFWVGMRASSGSAHVASITLQIGSTSYEAAQVMGLTKDDTDYSRTMGESRPIGIESATLQHVVFARFPLPTLPATITSARVTVELEDFDTSDITFTLMTAPGEIDISYADTAEDNEQLFTDAGVQTEVSEPSSTLPTVTTSFTYDSAGNILTETVPGEDQQSETRTTTYTYWDSEGVPIPDRVKTVTDPLGNETSYGYNTKGCLTSVVEPVEGTTTRTTTYVVDTHGRTTDVEDPIGRTTTTVYDAADQPTEVYFPASVGQSPRAEAALGYAHLGGLTRTKSVYDEGSMMPFRVVTTTYGTMGELLTRVDGDPAHAMTRTYDGIYRLKTEQVGPDAPQGQPDNKTSYVYVAATPTTPASLTVTDPAGVTVTRTADSVGRLSTVQMGGGTRTYGYSAYSQVDTVTEPNDGAMTINYDGLGNTSRIVTPTGTSHAVTDARGATVLTTRRTATDAKYDARAFFPSGKLHESITDGAVTSCAYDAAGRLVTSEGPTGQTVVRGYDKLNRLRSLTDGDAATTYYTYDAANQLTDVTGPAGPMHLDYDGLGRVTKRQITNKPDARYTYTHLSLLHEQFYGDDLYPTVHCTYDGSDRLTQVADASVGTRDLAYNQSTGRLTSVTTKYVDLVDGQSQQIPHVLTYGYDGAGRRSSLTVIQGQSTLASYTYGYSAAGQWESLLRDTVTVGEWEYDYRGRTTLQTQGNGATTHYAFDEVTGRLSLLDNWACRYVEDENQQFTWMDVRTSRFALDGYAATENGDPVHHYDARSRLTGLSFRVVDHEDEGCFVNRTFTYDKYGQLTQDFFDSLMQGGYFDHTMEYDTRGNVTRHASEITGYTGSGFKRNYGANNQWVGYLQWDSQTETWVPNEDSEDLFAYDSAGNPTTYKGDTLAYDNENRLTSYTRAGQTTPALTADYRSDHLRAWKADASGHKRFFIYDGDQPVLEVAEDGTILAETIWGANGLLQRIEAQSTDHGQLDARAIYYQFDPLGNVVQRLDADGEEISYDLYDAWGNPVAGTEATDPYGYKGQYGYYTDHETGLIYCHHRYYDPAAGRWLTKDPISYEGGLNLYGYCGNEPVEGVDAEGLEYIVYSGYALENNWRYNFIEPAVKKLIDFVDAAKGETVTWLIDVSRGSIYDGNDIGNFQNVAQRWGVTVVFVDGRESFVNYINNKDTKDASTQCSEERRADPVRRFVFYGHGHGHTDPNKAPARDFSPGRFWSFRAEDVASLCPQAFDKADSQFYSCRAANGEERSIGQAWANRTGGSTRACYGATTYFYLLYNPDDPKGVQETMRKRGEAARVESRFGFSIYGSNYHPRRGDDMQTEYGEDAAPHWVIFRPGKEPEHRTRTSLY